MHYDTKGDVVSPLIISGMVDYNGGQGQLIQEKQKDYTIKLNVSEAFHKEVNIIKEFKGYLGNDA